MICKVLFLNQNTKNSKIFFASSKKSHLSTRDMTRSVLLRLKSGQLIASQILELCCSYGYDNNHNYNKILKSDWRSTALISAVIGQFDRTVRVMPK